MKRFAIDIGGMSCDHCVQSVRRALSEVPGVSSADVSLSPGRAVVEFEGEMPGVASAVQAVAKSGYTVTGFRELTEAGAS